MFIEAGRRRQLRQLHQHLDEAIRGKSQVIFLSGDAGVGKSTLLRFFCREAQQKHQQLIVVQGECNALLGLGEAYLPFKNIFALLTGNTSGEIDHLLLDHVNKVRLKNFLISSLETILELGGGLIGAIIPGAGLIEWVGTVTGKILHEKLSERIKNVRPAQDLSAEQLFEQTVRVLVELARKQPLIVIIEDLHWADSGTLTLLFHLNRRLQQMKPTSLFLIGTYRPNEASELLKKLVNETRRYRGNALIDLNLSLEENEGYTFVDNIVDLEPNKIDRSTRELIFKKTGGHPLFTIELLKMLKEKGFLAKDGDGYLYVAKPIAFDRLPDRVEAVVMERIQSLTEDLREMLRIGSVEGEEFTAEVIARLREVSKSKIIARLSRELDQKARLLHASGSISLSHQKLYRFRFRHALFQFFLYQRLGQAEREILHSEVGDALEDLYGEELDRIAAQLAYHFELGKVPQKAILYYSIAGKRSLREFANNTSADLFSRALSLLSLEPQSTDNKLEYLNLLLNRATAYDRMGLRQEQKTDLDISIELATELQAIDELAAAQIHLAQYHYRIGEYLESSRAANEALVSALSIKNLALVCDSLLQLSRAYYAIDDWRTIKYAEAAVRMAQHSGNLRSEGRSSTVLALELRERGDYVRAKEQLAHAVKLSQESGDFLCEIDALQSLGLIRRDQGYFQSAVENANRAISIAQKIGDLYLETEVASSLAVDVLTLNGNYSDAILIANKALEMSQEMNNSWAVKCLVDELGHIYYLLGQYSTSREYLERSRDELSNTEDEAQIGWNLMYLSRTYLELGIREEAKLFAVEAAGMFEQAKGDRNRYHSLTNLGYVFESLNELDEAQICYSQAMDFASGLELDNWVITEEANLARIALKQKQIDVATRKIENVSGWIAANGINRFADPLLIGLSCINILKHSQDKETDTPQLASQLHQLLSARAAGIQERSLRQSYLNNVSINRKAIIELNNLIKY